MKTVLRTLLVVLVVEVAGGLAFIYSGFYDVAAVHPDNRVIAWVIHKTSDRSVNARLGGIVVPPGLDKPDRITAGGQLFAQDCVVCHGGPGLQPSGIAVGLNPTPANLFRAARRVDPAEAYWFIANGVKMTAMPGFSKSRQVNDLWSLVAFVAKAPGMSAPVFSAATGITTPVAAVPPVARPAGG